jgi:uncharacterized protein DUF2382
MSRPGVFLNCDKDELDRMGWDRRPDERASIARTAESDQTLQLREVELQARTTSVETGRVHVGKEVVEKERTIEVPVAREEVYVERRRVDRRPADAPIDETQAEPRNTLAPGVLAIFEGMRDRSEERLRRQPTS